MHDLQRISHVALRWSTTGWQATCIINVIAGVATTVSIVHRILYGRAIWQASTLILSVYRMANE